MNDERDKIKEKIKKLLNLAKDNTTEDEMNTCMLKVRQLMMEYKLSESEIDDFVKYKPRNENIIEERICDNFKTPWKYCVFTTLINHFPLKWSFIKHGNTLTIFVYGIKYDVELFIKMLQTCIYFNKKKHSQIYYQIKKRGEYIESYKNDYSIGFSYGINEKYVEQDLESESYALVSNVPVAVKDFHAEKVNGTGTVDVKTIVIKNELIFDEGVREGKQFNSAIE